MSAPVYKHQNVLLFLLFKVYACFKKFRVIDDDNTHVHMCARTHAQSSHPHPLPFVPAAWSIMLGSLACQGWDVVQVVVC